ncbi:cupin domain-containing protein [bacterium]|nr:cupin domain-containing protein [bacterium]
MQAIRVERRPPAERLEALGVRTWPVWTKEISTFSWSYEEPETCFFLEGDVTVTPQCGDPVRIGEGDLVTFPEGLDCTWDVHKPVRKHYRFG